MNTDKPPSPSSSSSSDQPSEKEAAVEKEVAMDIDQEEEASKHSQPCKAKSPLENDDHQPPSSSSSSSSSTSISSERPTNQFSQLAIHDQRPTEMSKKSLGKRPVVYMPKQPSPVAPKEASLGEIRHAIDNPNECERLIREQELLLASFQKKHPQESTSSIERANSLPIALLFSDDDDKEASPTKKPCHLDPRVRAGVPTAMRSLQRKPMGPPPPSPDRAHVPEVGYKLPVAVTSSSGDGLLPGQTILKPKCRRTTPQEQTGDPLPKTQKQADDPVVKTQKQTDSVVKTQQGRPTVGGLSVPGWKREDSSSSDDDDDYDYDADSD